MKKKQKAKQKQQGKTDHQITISGIVTPAEWDKDDNIIALAISTSDEKEYLIDDDAMGEDFLDLISHHVKVTGVITADEGYDVINVKAYEVL